MEAVLVLAEVLLDDLALHGDPQSAVDGAGRLAHDGQVAGPAARGLHSFAFQLNLSRFSHTSPCPPV